MTTEVPRPCQCPDGWPRLFTVIAGARYSVAPTVALTGTSALYRAWCVDCGAEYPHPFRIDYGQQSRAA